MSLRKTLLTIGTAAVVSALAGGVGMAEEVEISYPSRDTEVQATLTLPEEQENMPLVVICHGHGGDRNEGVGLSTLAEALASDGIASIRMDYPGCGASTEAFTANTMTNMKADTVAAIEYVTENYSIDEDKEGIFGYSTGGRIALEIIAEDMYEFDAACFLAPAADTDDLKELFGGADAWEELKAAANASEDGYADFTTIYGQEQQLSVEWFDDLEKYAGDSLIAAAAEKFSAPALVINAKDDEAVSPSVSEAVAEALNANRIVTKEDGHTYGFYSDKTEILHLVTEGASGFFKGVFSYEG